MYREECYAHCFECQLLNSRCLAFILYAVDKPVDVGLALCTLDTLKVGGLVLFLRNLWMNFCIPGKSYWCGSSAAEV